MSTPPPSRRGIALTLTELYRLGAQPRVGFRFESDQLDLFTWLFEVVEVEHDRVVVQRLTRRGAPAVSDRGERR